MTGQLQKWWCKLILNRVINNSLLNVSFSDWNLFNLPYRNQSFQRLVFASRLDLISWKWLIFAIYLNMRQVTELFYFLEGNRQISVILLTWNGFYNRWTRTPRYKITVIACIFNNVEYCPWKSIEHSLFRVMNLLHYVKSKWEKLWS